LFLLSVVGKSSFFDSFVSGVVGLVEGVVAAVKEIPVGEDKELLSLIA
jgi:hypothetical protein